MCDKLPYCARKIDPCMVEKVNKVNTSVVYRTRSSCCGHGRYPMTIIVQNKISKEIFELFSGRRLTNVYLNGKPRKRFYKKDPDGYYYIPEVRR